MLTKTEKEVLREIICVVGMIPDSQGNMQRISPAMLKEWSLKSDEHVREIINVYLTQKKFTLQNQIDVLTNNLNTVISQIDDVAANP